MNTSDRVHRTPCSLSQRVPILAGCDMTTQRLHKQKTEAGDEPAAESSALAADSAERLVPAPRRVRARTSQQAAAGAPGGRERRVVRSVGFVPEETKLHGPIR